jgi:hypothetical protein
MGAAAIGNSDTMHTAATNVPTDCCNFSISPNSVSLPAGGFAGSVTVNAGASCTWSAVSYASFITITSGAVGSGNGTVNYSVAANTGAASRNGTLTIAGITFTVTQAGNSELLLNPSFETGTTPWMISGQVVRSTGTFPHVGAGYMILGAADNTTGALFQTVTIPSGGANLRFWLNITTSEAADAAIFDRCFVEVLSPAGAFLATVTTFSNQNSGTAGTYLPKGPFSLGAFAGQTVRIQFRVTEDVTLPTSFRLDDVSVQ